MATISFDKVAKLMTVEAPAVEITIQELHNLCVEFEDELDNLSTDIIVSSAGKEPLGGGVSVGITLTLINDWQLAFEARPGPAYIQCKVSGGNLVGSHVNGPVYPTAFTQVLITASSSATTADLEAIQYGSYAGGIWINSITGVSGTAYPLGTPENPVNNLTDAHTIAEDRGFTDFFFSSDYTFDNADILLDPYKFHGQGLQQTTFTFEIGCVLANSQMLDATVTGFVAGTVGFTDCLIVDLGAVGIAASDAAVLADRCLLRGTLTLPSNYSGTLTAVDCWALPDDSGSPPTMDVGNSTSSIQARNWSGLLIISNCTNNVDIRVFLTSGGVILDSTVTAGDFLISGVGTLTDNSTSYDVLDTNGLISKETITEINWDTVYVDVGRGVSGTTFPIGTQGTTVNNIADAKTIADSRDIHKFHLRGEITLTGDYSKYNFSGVSYEESRIICSNTILNHTLFDRLRLTGSCASGEFEANDCVFTAGFDGLYGIFDNCQMTGVFTVQAGKYLKGDRCSAGTGAIVDINGTGSVQQANFSGVLSLINCTNAGSIIAVAGNFVVTLDNTITAGIGLFSGIGQLIDNSSGMTSTVSVLPASTWDELLADHVEADSVGERLGKTATKPDAFAASQI